MADGSNPFRPWTPGQVEQAKQDTMKAYTAGKVTLPHVGKAFSAALEHTPDDVKYQLGNSPVKLKGQTSDEEIATYDLHKLDEILRHKGPMARPLGNVPKDHALWNESLVTKDILDTSITAGQGGGTLVRTDLVPTMNLWLNTRFPGADRFQRVPANGMNHTWVNQIDYGDANDNFLDEFGCPTISHGVYFQGSTNIAIIALERALTLKLQYAVRQSGMTYNGNMGAEDIELQNLVMSRAKLLQKAVYYGTTATGHVGDDEFGKTFVNGFNGLRCLISNHANTVHQNFYPTGYGPVLGDVTSLAASSANQWPITNAIDSIAGKIMDNGGMPTAIHLSTGAEQALRREGMNVVRYSNDDFTVGGGIVLGGRVRAIDTVAGLLPIVIVPAGGIGRYNVAAGDGTGFTAGTTVEDIYVLSENYVQMPYLGPADFTPIEIPTGLPSPDGTGCLTRRFMVFWMVGLALPIPIFQGKVRIPAQ